MDSFERAFERVVLVEGGYGNDPRDSGGATCYGITEATARGNGYTGPMQAMPLCEAKRIYRGHYWQALRLDDIAAISEAAADELFDTSVNCGVGVAGRFLQRSLNAFNLNGSVYQDLAVDGFVGDRTVEALRAFMARRGKQGELVLLRALNSLQGARYIDLVEHREKDEAFVFGWILNRVGTVA